MTLVTEVGRVESKFEHEADPFEMRKHSSRIVVHAEYAEGLYRIEECAYVQIVYGFHLAREARLRGPVYTGEVKGVFASRSPNRPSRLGVTTAKLVGVDGNVLVVTGLDALDGTPVYDIKPHAAPFDDPEGSESPRTRVEWANPRREMLRLVRARDLQPCLTIAGRLHGHYCPGLALGVYASVQGMSAMLDTRSDGLEELMAITEANSCFADGVQVVTGCTFGNNALVYADLGRTAVTLAARGDGRGLRVSVKPGFRDLLAQEFPEFHALFDTVIRRRAGSEHDRALFKEKAREAGFGLLAHPAERLFDVRNVSVVLPPYAPIVQSVLCDQCGESFMETKAARRAPRVMCRACDSAGYPVVTGAGIEWTKDLRIPGQQRPPSGQGS